MLLQNLFEEFYELTTSVSFHQFVYVVLLYFITDFNNQKGGIHEYVGAFLIVEKM